MPLRSIRMSKSPQSRFARGIAGKAGVAAAALRAAGGTVLRRRFGRNRFPWLHRCCLPYTALFVPLVRHGLPLFQAGVRG